MPGGTTVMAPSSSAGMPTTAASVTATLRGVSSARATFDQASATGTTESRPSAFMRHQPSHPE